MDILLKNIMLADATGENVKVAAAKGGEFTGEIQTGAQAGGFLIRAVPPGIVAELFQSLFQGRLPLLEDVFGQMQGRRLALAHESQEGVRIQRGRRRDFQLAGQGGRVLLVPGLEQAQDMLAHPLVHRGVFLEDGRDVRALEQFDESPAAVDVERRPGEFDELVMEGGPELDADAHGDAHDAGRAQQFAPPREILNHPATDFVRQLIREKELYAS